jgi:hypothetical protein
VEGHGDAHIGSEHDGSLRTPVVVFGVFDILSWTIVDTDIDCLQALQQ